MKLKTPVLAASLLMMWPVTAAFAQTVTTASLRGRIIDESGTGLPGVLVTLTPPGDAAREKTFVTDIEGAYHFDLLEPAAGYLLKAFIPEYATVIAGPIELVAGRTTRLNLTLQRANKVGETIHVEAEGEIVDTEQTETSTSYNKELIEGLPLLGRRFQDLLTLAPGVTDVDGDGNPNVRGSRDTGLQVRLDGTNVTNPLTGKAGQDINVETVEELEIITGGAPAEYGRADGGFANVITKSGTNDIQGSFKVFLRSDLLDSDGANRDRGEVPGFHSNDFFLTVGGPIRRDRAWSFTSIERLDEQHPIHFADGTYGLAGAEGWRGFAKVTWQASPIHKLAIQLNDDPLETTGNNIGPGVNPETDYKFSTGGPLPQLTWTAILSPSLLMQTTISRLNGNLQIDPVSGSFEPVVVQKKVEQNQFEYLFPCVDINCQDDPRIRRIFRAPSVGRAAGTEQEAGPYNIETDQDLDRTTLRSDLSYTLDNAGGQHAIKAGFEFNVESYAESGLNNPVLTDRSCRALDCSMSPLPPNTPGTVRLGRLLLEVYDPLYYDRAADGIAAGAYAQDTWKPRPNLALNLGLRFDQETIDTAGRTDFNPLAEAREVLARFDALCDAAGSGCTNRLPGQPSATLPAYVTPPPGHPALQFDLNGDGVIETNGAEGAAVYAPYTSPGELVPDHFQIKNTNLSPRFGVSWDPFSDGKTKLFGTWGVYYDRLFLGTTTTGQLPFSYTAQWYLGSAVSDQAYPGDPSDPISPASINQTDRNLRTPYTIEWTAGFERELAPEWAVSLVWVRRRGVDLLQDRDENHITCKQFDSAFHVAPYDVCGDGGALELDRFGEVQEGIYGFSPVPNGAIDLYVLNRRFNQILRVENANSSEYTSADLILQRRLRNNWQMQLAYTYSRASGEAESFTSIAGNDPAVGDKVPGYLDYDQRHVVKFQTVTILPHQITVGSSIQWASGLPYTFIRNVADSDSVGSITPERIFSISGRKNDQRNAAQLTIDVHIEKRFTLGKAVAAAFLDGENLLDNDELVLREVDQGDRGVVQGERRFGRRWQMGFSVYF